MRRLRIVSIVLVAVLVAGWVALGRLAPRLIAERLARATGLDVTVGRVALGWSDGRLTLHDVVLRGVDGTRLVQARSLVVGVGMLRQGPVLRLDGALGRGVTLLDLPPTDGRARRLRLRAAKDALLVDGVIERDGAVIAVTDGRIDPTARTLTAGRVGLAGTAIAALPARWPVATDRLVVTDARLGDAVVERLVAGGVARDTLPERLRARVRLASGTIRLRWSAAPERLDVRLVDVPLRAVAGNPFRDATLSGGVTSGVVRLGRVPGTLAGRLRVGPTRLQRGGETWLGWTGLAAKIGRFDVRTRRLLAAEIAFTEPVVIARRDAAGVWPASGWETWISPAAAIGAGGVMARLVGRFAIAPPEEEPAGSTFAVAGGTVTFVDATTEPPARLTVRELDARLRHARASGVEAWIDGRIGDGGTLTAALAIEPLPRATLTIRGMPTVLLGGWASLGGELLGIPLGRALALAGAGEALDVDVDVTGEPTEKRFGLATKALETLVATLRDRVTTPLLASAEMRRDEGIETLVLPAVPVDADAAALVGEASDVADRLAVLLAQFPELSVRLDGRFGPDEPASRGEARAAAVEAHLAALGFADRVVLGTVAGGPPGVTIVVGGRVS